jgi:hypothetical protein
VKKKFRYAALVILFLFSLFCSAQTGRDKVETLRAAFINKKLGLTASESEKFWPLFNEYNDKVRALRRQLRQDLFKWSDNSTDQDAEELFTQMLRTREAEAELFRLYSGKFRQILGVRKVVKLQLAEEEFKREMISTIREKGE